MSRATSRKRLMAACLTALHKAEDEYTTWTGGITMRSAPESLVQTRLAQELVRYRDLVLLEVSVKDILSAQKGEDLSDVPRGNGRIDLAVFFKSKGRRATPRFLVEVKKLKSSRCLDDDFQRIQKVMRLCPEVQNGIMVGYCTAVKEQTAMKRVKKVAEHLSCKLVAEMPPRPAIGRRGKERFLAAGVYQVDR